MSAPISLTRYHWLAQFNTRIVYHCTLSIFVLVFCLVTDANAQFQPQAVILQYHHISSSTPPSTSTSVEDFRTHMEYLRDTEFQVLALEDIITRLKLGQDVPEKSAVITFDDGFLSIYDEAFPILSELNWPFTVFVTSSQIKDDSSLYMSWEQVNELAEAGATIANHTLSHPSLVSILPRENDIEWEMRIRNEIVQAEAEILQHTGQSHRLLAYPYGEYSLAIKSIVNELGYIGIAQHSGPINANSDFLALPRYPLSGIYAAMNTFMVKVNSLAFNAVSLSPMSPETSSPSPSITLGIAESNYRPEQLTCYNNNEVISTTAMNAGEQIGRMRFYRLESAVVNSSRRFHYNCTAPAISGAQAGQYYWFSVPWLNPGISQ